MNLIQCYNDTEIHDLKLNILWLPQADQLSCWIQIVVANLCRKVDAAAALQFPQQHCAQRMAVMTIIQKQGCNLASCQ